MTHHSSLSQVFGKQKLLLCRIWTPAFASWAVVAEACFDLQHQLSDMCEGKKQHEPTLQVRYRFVYVIEVMPQRVLYRLIRDGESVS